MDLYPLTERFIEATAFYASTDPAFVSKIGHRVEPKRVPDGPAKNLLTVVKQAWLTDGRGPSSSVTVLQRLRSMVDDGRITRDELIAASNMLDEVEDDPKRPSVEDVIATLVPVLRKDYAERIADAAAEDFGKGGDFARTIKLIDEQRRVGVVDEDLGGELDDDAAAEMEDLGFAERLPLGIPELDAELQGGPRISCFGMLLGGTGDGKSVGLTHIGGTALLERKTVALATLEVGRADINGRLLGRILGWEIEHVMRSPRDAMRAAKELNIGRFHVKEFDAGVATFPDIANWVDALEQKKGYAVDVLITDYGDKLAPHKAGASKKTDDSTYKAGSVIWEAMRDWCKGQNRWHWTASQSKRRKDKKTLLDNDDTADSLHKARISELTISLNVEEDQSQITFKVAKHRHGGGGAKVGPLPTDFGCGRLIAL